MGKGNATGTFDSQSSPLLLKELEGIQQTLGVDPRNVPLMRLGNVVLPFVDYYALLTPFLPPSAPPPPLPLLEPLPTPPRRVPVVRNPKFGLLRLAASRSPRDK